MVAYFSAVVIAFGDFTRFVRSEREMKIGNLVELPLTAAFFSFIALIITAGTLVLFGEVLTNPMEIIDRVDALPFTIIAAVTFFASTVGINLVANFIPPAYDLADLFPSKIDFRMGGLITVTIAFFVDALSIPNLFIAGIVPGLLIALSLMTTNYMLCRQRGYLGLTDTWSVPDIRRALKKGIWSILTPLIILGGIHSGFFTPTESAIVAIFYTLFVGIFLHKELRFQAALHALKTTTWISGRVLLILFTATVFGRLLVEKRIPAVIAGGMLAMTQDMYLIWAMIIVFLLFVGMFMETLATILILTPVLLPVMYSLGADPVHVGIVVVRALAIGFQTPPLGENLFVASGISGASIEQISLRALPFAAMSILAVFIIAYVPDLSLWLPRVLGY